MLNFQAIKLKRPRIEDFFQGEVQEHKTLSTMIGKPTTASSKLVTNKAKVISLNCIISGDKEEKIFTLKISNQEPANALKPMIKNWWPFRF